MPSKQARKVENASTVDIFDARAQFACFKGAATRRCILIGADDGAAGSFEI